jgi:lysozyme
VDITRLVDSIKHHEGLRLRSYLDSVGVWTIGYGTNLQTLLITEEIADDLLQLGVHSAMVAAAMFPEWQYLDTEARRGAFCEMCYNLGPMRLSGFRKMLDAIKAQDWQEVAKQALDSKWATQVGQRAVTLITMLQTGEFPAQE